MRTGNPRASPAGGGAGGDVPREDADVKFPIERSQCVTGQPGATHRNPGWEGGTGARAAPRGTVGVQSYQSGRSVSRVAARAGAARAARRAARGGRPKRSEPPY